MAFLRLSAAIVIAVGDHARHATRRGVLCGERSSHPAGAHGLPELAGAADGPSRAGAEGVCGRRQ